MAIHLSPIFQEWNDMVHTLFMWLVLNWLIEISRQKLNSFMTLQIIMIFKKKVIIALIYDKLFILFEKYIVSISS